MHVLKVCRWEVAMVVAGLLTMQGSAQTGSQTAQTSVQTPAATAVQAAPQQAATTQAAPTSSPAGTRVHGTITDPDGELIPGATVSFTPTKGGGAGKTAKSGSDGTYAITLPAGSYTYVVSMTGFASYSTLNLKIAAVATGLTLDAKLQIGAETQVVNVDANSVQLSVDPDSNASATVLSGKDLDALSDDPDELSSELTALAGPSAGPNGGQIYVDGFTGGQLPPKSSIREIRINQNPFSAQYDKLGYGRVEIFTKPGTDKLHGSLQVNGNPSQLNSANPLITVPQSPYHTLFLFGTVTGPINKFASYSVGGSHRDIEDNEFTNATILAQPGTTTLCSPGQASCLAVTAPTPFQQSTYFPQSRTDFTPKIDLALGSKNVLTTRYQFVTNTASNASIGNLQLASNGQNTSQLSNQLQMSDTQTYSSKLINETRFEYEREHVTDTAISNAPTVSVSGAFTGGGDSGQNLSDHQDHFEVQNYTSLQLKKNFLRFGGRFRSTREAQNTTAGTNGQFIYSSLLTPTCAATNPGCVLPNDNSYQSGKASQFGLTIINQPKLDFTFADLGLYLETDWKPRQNLSISYGIRYETQNNEPDHHDFAPRASFAYGIGKGTPKTVVRGGFGLFYDRFGQGNILTLRKENGINETILTLQNPTCTTVAACKTQATPQAQTVYSMSNSLRSPYIVQFALGVDQQLGRAAKISITGLHSQGIHQLVTQNIDYGAATQSSNGVNYQYFTEGAFQQSQLNINPSVQLSRKLSLFGFVSLNSAHGDSSGAGSFISTPGNLRADYGRTTFDVTARYFMAGSITLPYFIQLSPFLIGQSGNPYNVTSGIDSNGDTIFNDRPYAVNANTATAANASTVKTIAGCGTFALPGSQPAGSSIAPLNACTGPALFTLNLRVTKTFGFGNKNGTAQTASQGGGGRSGAAMGMGGAPGGGGGGRGGAGGGSGGPPSTSTGKKYNLQVGAQFQNLFANTDYATPIAVLTSTRFGQSTQVTGGPYTSDSALRRIQLTASFSF